MPTKTVRKSITSAKFATAFPKRRYSRRNSVSQHLHRSFYLHRYRNSGRPGQTQRRRPSTDFRRSFRQTSIRTGKKLLFPASCAIGGTRRTRDIDTNNAAGWKDRNFLNIVLCSRCLTSPVQNSSTLTRPLSHLRIVSEITGEPLNPVHDQELLEPLQFAEYAFSTDPKDFYWRDRRGSSRKIWLNSANSMFKTEFITARILSKSLSIKPLKEISNLIRSTKKEAHAKGGMNGQYLYESQDETRRCPSFF